MKRTYTGILWIFAALLISLNITLMKGCAELKPALQTDITSTISCPIADDLTCQKCHAWKKTIADWHNPETGKAGKIEIILPENVDIEWNTGQTVIINPDSSGKDWICSSTFYRLGKNYSLQVLYDKWTFSHLPPEPPLALMNIVYTSDSGTQGISQYWIYENGVPVEVEQQEWELFVQGLKSGENI